MEESSLTFLSGTGVPVGVDILLLCITKVKFSLYQVDVGLVWCAIIEFDSILICVLRVRGSPVSYGTIYNRFRKGRR